MVTLSIDNKKLSGTLQVQPSKYLAHRYILAAALAQGKSTLSPMLKNNDLIATLGATEALGLAKHRWDEDSLEITGGNNGHGGVVDCNESGSTLRFIVPIAAALGLKAQFTGKGRLLERPMTPYEDIFRRQHLRFDRKKEGIFIEGQLAATHYELPGNVSSQFITGLLFALPLLPESSTINLTSFLESRGYVEMTLSVLKKFGVRAQWKSDFVLHVPGGQSYYAAQAHVDGDWAHAAFFLVAGALGNDKITLTGLSKEVAQDSEIVPILQKMGADISWDGKKLSVKASQLKAIQFDGKDIPDLIPILAVAATQAEGKTVFRHLGRLRYKESNRLEGLAEQLRSIGADAQVVEDDLHIVGGALRGGRALSLDDHRIAMSLAVASTCTETGVTLIGVNSVEKSAPRFWEEFSSLGGIFHGK